MTDKIAPRCNKVTNVKRGHSRGQKAGLHRNLKESKMLQERGRKQGGAGIQDGVMKTYCPRGYMYIFYFHPYVILIPRLIPVSF